MKLNSAVGLDSFEGPDFVVGPESVEGLDFEVGLDFVEGLDSVEPRTNRGELLLKVVVNIVRTSTSKLNL